MKATIVHLSDIHFKKSNLRDISEKIACAVSADHAGCELCLVLITGDIAYSGKKEEYKLAEDFVRNIESNLEKTSRKIKFVFCPGNHDCDFSKDETVRNILIESLLTMPNEKINQQLVDKVAENQDNYFDFQDKFHGKENRIFSRTIIELAGCKILVDSLNVSWMSKIKESQGKIVYPIHYIRDPEPSDLRIVIYHHPPNWLESSNARLFNQTLEKNYHLVFSGHEHTEKYVSTVDLNSNDHSTYFYGGVLNEHNERHSSFTSIEIDIKEGEFYFKTWKLDPKEDLYIANEEDCHCITVGKKGNGGLDKGVVTDDFGQFLNSVEIPFQHPRESKLTIEKIYTPASLRRADKRDDDKQERIKSDHLHNKLIKEKLINILGDSQSGKTTTLKVLYKGLLDKDFFPIYLDGSQIKKKHEREIDSIIKSALKMQYRSPSVENIVQKKSARIAILIDGLDLSSLNSEARDDVINYLSKKYEYIVLTMSVASFATNFAVSTESSLLPIFTSYNLEEFSYSARGELIESWVKLGQEDSLSERDLNLIVHKKEDLINSLVHANLLPTLPGHILLILQYIETGTINPDMTGSYGYIYQSLVTATLNKSRKFPIDTLVAYLANLAFEMYEKRSTSLDHDEAIRAHEAYNKFSRMDIDKESIIGDLTKIGIIKDLSGYVSFRHPYLFYYFVAIYFHKRAGNASEIELAIDRMIESLHRDDSCNILIFYSHISSHHNVINKILNKINSEFTDHEPCRFDLDTLEISRLYQGMATIIIDDKTPKKRREIRNRNLDDAMPAVADKRSLPDNSTGYEYKLTACFRALDVLGQILRANVANLSGDIKDQSVRSGCDMALRIISSFNRFIVEKSGEIIDEIKSTISEKNLSEHEANELAMKFVATVSELIIFSILKKLSASIGFQLLTPSFANLALDAGEIISPPSYKLIEVMIRIDNSANFPKTRVESAYQNLRGSYLGKRMLQRIVHFHFLKYKIDYDLKQWAQDLLAIKYVSSRGKEDPRSLSRSPIQRG